MAGTLIFDGDCGFCTRSRNLLARLDRRGRIRTVPLQRPGIAEEAGVDRARLRVEVCWIAADGTAHWGAEAINDALSEALGNRVLSTIYRLPGMRRLQDAGYRFVAANRHRLPGTTPWCAANPADCTSHGGWARSGGGPARRVTQDRAGSE